MGMKHVAWLAPFVIAAASASSASAGLTGGHFDSIYRGTTHLVAPLSANSCAPLNFPAMRVADGKVGAVDSRSMQRFSGFVKRDGFVSATYGFKHGTSRLQGRIAGDTFVGGLISPGGQCKWIVELHRAPK